MNAIDRAERALYATLDCGGPRVMKARGNVATRLNAGKRPRSRDLRALEQAAALSGNATPEIRDNWRKARPAMAVRRNPVKRMSRIAGAFRRVANALHRVAEAIWSIPGGEPSCWRDAGVLLLGAVWGGMVTFGILLAVAARHAP